MIGTQLVILLGEEIMFALGQTFSYFNCIFKHIRVQIDNIKLHVCV